MWLALLALGAFVVGCEWQAARRVHAAVEEVRACGDDHEKMREDITTMTATVQRNVGAMTATMTGDTRYLLQQSDSLLETCHALIAWMHEQWERDPEPPPTEPSEAVITPQAIAETPRRPTPRKRTGSTAAKKATS